jgi:virulence factor Mce-like protein
MTSSRHRRLIVVAVLAALLLAGAGVIVKQRFLGPTTITADFASATGVYPGDDVRVAGLKVGTIRSITPQGATARVTLEVRHGIPIPADAKAVLVAQNLISARYIQLAPAYESDGPVMADGAVIPLARTAIPVEWDDVKQQLMRLATDLGPQNGVEGTAVGRFIDSAAAAMDGNGDKLRASLAQLSAAGRVLADGSGDMVDVIKNLQVFVTALRDSNEQIVQFQDRMATLTSVVDNSRTDLDSMVQSLSVVVGDIQRFVAGTRDRTSQQLNGLLDVTNNLVAHKTDVENILHVAPNAFANQMNMYNPETGAAVGAFVMNNFSNPVQFICGTIGAIENATAPETSKLCAQYLGPALSTMNFNYLPFPMAPFLTPSPSPDRIVYSEQRLAPGGSGPKPEVPSTPPAVSAYAGAPADAAPASQAPVSPILPVPVPATAPPAATDLEGLLLPAEGPSR